MKICFVIIRWKGGVGTVIKSLKKELESKGHEVFVISREDDLKIFSFKNSLFKLKKALPEYDVLISMDWSIAIPLLGCKNHYCIFNGLELSSIQQLLQRYVYFRLKDKIMCVGDHMIYYYPKATAIELGVDLDLFKPKKDNLINSKIIGFLQTKSDIYSFEKIVEAVNNIDGAMLTTTWDSYVPHNEMSSIYNSLDVLVSLPPVNAGFNLVWLEAMACNTKVIGNNNGVGHKLPIKKLSYNPSVEDIELAIREQLDIGEPNTRQWIMDNKFTWENTVNKMLKVIDNGI